MDNDMKMRLSGMKLKALEAALHDQSINDCMIVFFFFFLFFFYDENLVKGLVLVLYM